MSTGPGAGVEVAQSSRGGGEEKEPEQAAEGGGRKTSFTASGAPPPVAKKVKPPPSASDQAFGPSEGEVIAKIDAATRNGDLDRADWAEIEPLLAGFRGRASKVAEALLDVVTRTESRSIIILDRPAIYDFLVGCGYEIPHDYGPINGDEGDMIKARRLPPPKPAEVEAAFIGIRKAGSLDEKRWTGILRPMLWRLPATTNAQTREALAIYSDAAIAMDEPVRQAFCEILRNFGFDLPRDRRATAEDKDKAEKGHIEAPDATFEKLSRATGAGGKTTIGVVDGGFDVKHPAVARNIDKNEGEKAANKQDDDRNGVIDDVDGAQFLGKGRPVLGDVRPSRDVESAQGFDMAGHGTAVLGISTKGTDRIEAVLVAYNANQIGECVDYAVKRGARVINASLSLTEPEHVKAWRQAIEKYPQVLFVQAAGNDKVDLDDPALDKGQKEQRAPANNLLEVASADKDGKPWQGGDKFGTNTDETNVDIAAFGGTHAPAADKTYRTGAATSMATPMVTNTAAKCMALDPQLTAVQVRAIIRGTARKSDDWKGKSSTEGLLDSDAAMQVAALIGMMRKGRAFDQAAEAIQLDNQRRNELEALANEILRM